MTQLAELEAEYEKLASDRARQLDSIGLGHARRMIERVRTVPEVARERLLARASLALAAVRARIETAHGQGVARIEALERDGFDVDTLRARLARGDATGVERTYRRTRTLGREVRRRDPALEARLASLARASGFDATSIPSAGGLASLAGRLFRRAAAEASATFVLERARTHRSVDAGRYHTESVASSVLLAMRDASPTYLRAQLARLELATEIQRFVSSFEPLKAPAPEKGRPSRARGADKSAAGAAASKKAAASASSNPQRPTLEPDKPAAKARKSTPRGKKR